MENTETLEQNIDNNNKEAKNFDVILKRLTAVLGGKEKLRPQKRVSPDAVSGIVNQLFKEEHEALVLNVKEELKVILKKYVELEKCLADKRKEVDKLEKEKKAEFSKAANALFEKIDNISEIEKNYQAALKNIEA